MKKGDANDPKGLILESYRMDGITAGECRSIFLDWALSLPMNADTQTTMAAVLAQYEPAHPAHPMTQVLHEGLEKMATPRRRGGYRGRRAPDV